MKGNRLLRIISFLCALLLFVGSLSVVKTIGVVSFVFSIILPVLFFANIIFLIYWGVKRKKHFFFHLLSVLVYFLYFDSLLRISTDRLDEHTESFTFLSYNVKGLFFHGDNRREIVNFIKKKDPDIIAFQEFARDGFESFEHYPYRFIAYRDKVPKSLLVIYSKFQIVNKGYVSFADTRNGAIFADIKYKDEIIRVYNLHLQSFGIRFTSNSINENEFSRVVNIVSKTINLQKEQALKVVNHSKSFLGKSIICGDFNSTQFSSIYRTLREDRNDSFIEKGNGFGTTYNLSNYPIRLDFVLPDFSFKTVSHENFKLKLSDHEPVYVKLAVK